MTCYAALNMNILTFTPSLEHTMNDSMLSYTFLNLTFKYLLPKDTNAESNAYLNPILLPDWVLQKFPPSCHAICERDPMSDESFRFAEK